MGFYENVIFPPVMEWSTRVLRSDIAAVLSEAKGSVLEIGAGTGANLHYYTSAVSEVTCIEPVAAMVDMARKKIKKSDLGFPVQIEEGDARALTYADDRFDTIVACLVFCTIPQPEQAAAEMFRVLKPGGKLVFYEHVASRNAGVKRWQKRINPLWKKLACGCEITRDTRSLFEEAGFRYGQIRDFNHPKLAPLMAPIICGVATKE